jgi:hypothetical protein
MRMHMHMHMCYSYDENMLERRLQVLVDEERYQRLVAVARQRNVSVAAVVRHAIDDALSSRGPERSAAARQVLSAPRMPVPDTADLLSELEDLRGRRR